MEANQKRMKQHREIYDKAGGDIFAHIHPVIALMLKGV
jgi:hypothetical protein